jgi:hypothetical protein
MGILSNYHQVLPKKPAPSGGKEPSTYPAHSIYHSFTLNGKYLLIFHSLSQNLKFLKSGSKTILIFGIPVSTILTETYLVALNVQVFGFVLNQIG